MEALLLTGDKNICQDKKNKYFLFIGLKLKLTIKIRQNN